MNERALSVKSVTIFFVFVSLFILTSQETTHAAWVSSFTDNFNRTNGAIANGWVGATSTASIVSNALYLNSTKTTPWTSSVLLRPVNEVTTEQRVLVTFSAAATNGFYVGLRTQTPGTEYLVGFDASNSLVIRPAISGTLGTTTSAVFNPAFDVSHSYQLDASVTGTNPTVVTASVTDLGTSLVVASTTVSDTSASLQVNGQVGLFAYGIATVDDFTSYSMTAATTYTVSGPSSDVINQASSNFTVTPDGVYNGTITPSDGAGGGTFTPASLVFASSSVAKTFTYTPTTIGIKSISLSSSPGLTNPSPVSLTARNSSAIVWDSVTADNFNRTNGAIANGWVGATSTASIVSNALYLNSGTSNPWTNSLVLRPVNEVTRDQRAKITYLGTNTNAVYLAFRGLGFGNEYIVGVNTPANCTGTYCISAFYVTSGVLHAIGTSAKFTSFNSTHNYQLDTSVTGTNPTSIIASVTDLTTSVIVASTTLSDSTAALQVNGQVGLFAYGTATVDDYNNYSASTTVSAATYTMSGPSSGIINQASGNFTVTPNGIYTGTITPSDGGAGGTFTPTSLAFAGTSVAQTFTYTPASTGTKTISVSSSPALIDPLSVSISVSSLSAGTISVGDSNLIWSPYNWKFNGSAWTETTPGGGYVKLAFTGSTLSIGVSTVTMTGVTLSSVAIHAYVDGVIEPISKTLADADPNGIITFSSALSTTTNHYAQIYLSKTPALSDRWTGPAEVLRVTKIQLASDGNILSPTSTPVARKSRKILVYGDSITEGVNVSQAENAYSAIMGRQLGFEYGQVGYGFLGWTHQGSGATAYFYDTTATSSSLWRNYDATGSRLVNNVNLSSGFIDGVPDAVFVNLGINDANYVTGSALMRTKMTNWLTDVRQVVGTSTAIFVISPFNFGNTSNSTYVTYKAALLGGISDFQSSHPLDSRIYILDLGLAGFNTILANSSDNLHPNDTGSSILGLQLAALASPNIANISANPSGILQSSTGNIVTITGVNTAWPVGSTTVFTMSGGTGASIVSQITANATSATLSLNAGSAAGTLLITDTSTTASTSISVSAFSADAALSGLTISSGTLSPSFLTGTYTYTDSVANGTSSVTVTPTVNQANATIKVNTVSVSSGVASAPISLNVGANTISVVVTAQDGVTIKTYTITVTRAVASISANPSSLIQSSTGNTVTITGVNTAWPVGSTTVFTMSGGTGASIVSQITANATSATLSLNAGSAAGTLLITDTSTTASTSISVSAFSADAALSGLTISSGTLSPSFLTGTYTYTDSVANGTSSVTVTPTVNQANATIKVNTVSVSSGVASAPISLNVGANTISVVVTAQDGVTIKTYTITVTRAVAGAPSISSISSTSNSSAAVIVWTTDIVASSQVEYGLSDAYSASTTESDTGTRVLNHSVTLSDLPSCTAYHYRVYSKSESLAQAVSSDRSFVTSGCTGSASVITSIVTLISVSSGGSVSGANSLGRNVTITVPSAFTSTSSQVTFEIKEIGAAAFSAAAGTPSGLTLLGVPYNLSAYIGATSTITTFDKSLLITLPYDPTTLGTVPASSLSMKKYDIGAGWTSLTGCSTDTSLHTVSCETSGFSDFAIFGQTPAPVVVAPTPSSGGGGGSPPPLPAPAVITATTTASTTPSLPNCPRGFICSVKVATTTPKTCNVAYKAFDTDMSIGMSGAAVTSLQQLLGKLNFSIAASTGNFGPLTVQSVTLYRKARGISEASLVGPLTRAALNIDLAASLCGTSTTTTTTSTPGSVVKPILKTTITKPTSFPRDLTFGSVGEDVRALQVYLNNHDFIVATSGEGSPGHEVLTFGNKTKAALIKFQKANGISATGYFGPITRKAVRVL